MEQAIVKLISEDFLSTTTNDLTPKSQITVSQKCEGIDCNSLSQ